MYSTTARPQFIKNHMMSMDDPIATGAETLRIDSGCSLEKEFTKLIRMNPRMVLYLIFNQVDSCHGCVYGLTDRIDVVVNCTPIRVKIKSKLTNSMKITRIEGYNDKYMSNLQGTREISHDLFEFDQIG